MIILILALIFGLAVLAFSAAGLVKSKRSGAQGKVITILRALVGVEAIVYIALFIFVLIKTIAM